MTSEPLAPGAPAIILFRQVDRDDNGRTSHEDNYLRIKILTEEGRKNADVEIPFIQGSNDVVHVRARTIRPDGSIAEFDGKVLEKTIEKTRGFKYVVKTFNLPDVQVGSVIEYFFTYDYKEYSLYDSHWILSQELFTKAAKFSLKPYSGSFENPFRIRWAWHELPKGTAQPQEGADHIIRLEAHNIQAFQIEDFMPPENEMKARVDFIYSDEAFEPDVSKYWKQVGKKLNARVESFVGKRKAMEEAVGQIVSPNDAPEVKLRKIYDRVQQLRNTSYELRKTEQEQKREKEKEPANVEEVWKRGYARGVDLTWLFLGLVRAAGFEAYPVYVSDRNNSFFTPSIMDRTRLDANVVLVKVNGKDLYFDPGAALAPFGLLIWPESGVVGLRLDKDGGAWIQSTLPRSSESRTERKASLKLSDTGDLEGITNQPDWKSASQPLVAEFSVKIPGWVSGAGRRALLPVGIFSATEKHVFEHTNRVHPIYFKFPFEKVDDITIDLPTNWEVQSLPKPQNQDAHIVTYTLQAEKGANSIHLTRRMMVEVLLLDPKYYPALRDFFQVVRTGDEGQIVLQPGAASASN